MDKISLRFTKAVTGCFKVGYSCVRPLLGPHGVCRFTPTCSQYAFQAIDKYGLIKGSWLALKRLGKCHPWHPGGYDPVP